METMWKQSGGTGNSGTVEQCSGTVKQRKTVLLNSVEEQCEQCGGIAELYGGTKEQCD